MKVFFKKYWLVIIIALIINVPILIMSCSRVDKTITLKGDTTIIERFVEIDRDYEEEGSFSSVYVVSMENATIFQNLLVENSITSDIDDRSIAYKHLSSMEINKIGEIQHDSSMIYALICAYEKAKETNEDIILDYSFSHYKVSYYSKGSAFRIGDKIIGVNDVLAKDDYETFKTLFNEASSKKDGEYEFIISRNGLTKRITNTNENMMIRGYSFYDIYYAYPSYRIKNTSIGGSSGGLLQALAIYNSLVDEDITKGLKISGTGTISQNGKVGEIGGIKQKIFTAADDNMDIFLCPVANYLEALTAYSSLEEKTMKLHLVNTFDDALEVLKNA